MISIHVLLFAQVAVDIGQAELQLELPDNATVDDALAALSERYPSIALQGHQLAIAVNADYADIGHKLSPGDELALIPPVSGVRVEVPEDRLPQQANKQGAADEHRHKTGHNSGS